MTDNIQPKRKGYRAGRFTFKAVNSDEPMSKADEDELWDILIDMLVARYEAEYPELFKPRAVTLKLPDRDK